MSEIKEDKMEIDSIVSIKKFKFDEHLTGYGAKIKEYAKLLGVLVLTTKDQDMDGWKDSKVREKVIQEKEILITADKDFKYKYKDFAVLYLEGFGKLTKDLKITALEEIIEKFTKISNRTLLDLTNYKKIGDIVKIN